MLSEQRKKVARNEKTTHGISYSKNIANFEMFRVLKGHFIKHKSLITERYSSSNIYIYIYVLLAKKVATTKMWPFFC